MKRNMDQWMEEIIGSKQRKAMPIMTYPGLPLVNKGILEVIRDGQAQYQIIKALSDKYPSIAAMTIMDLSVEAEAFGSPVKYSDQEVPAVSNSIIEDDNQINLSIPPVGTGRTGVYLQAAGLSAKNIPDRPTFGGHIGPFSLAGRLMDMTKIMISLVLNPEGVHDVLEKCTGFLVEYAKAFKETGANGIIIAEPAAGLISPAQCAEFSSQYVQRIVEAVQDDSFLVILHNCGNTKPLVPSMLTTGAKGFHFGNAVAMTDILPQVPADRLVFGNIDPARVFKNGSVAEMEAKVSALLKETAMYPNYVLSSGCDIPPGTPTDNIESFFRALREFNFS